MEKEQSVRIDSKFTNDIQRNYMYGSLTGDIRNKRLNLYGPKKRMEEN